MSILKDEFLTDKQVQKAKKIKKSILANLKSKNVRCWLNQNAYDKFIKEESIKKQNIKNYTKIEEGEWDTSDLILNDLRLYKRFLIVARILEAQGLARDLGVRNGFVYSTDDKVREVLDKLSNMIDSASISDAALEAEATKAVIMVSDLDERNALNMELDADNNGRDDFEDRTFTKRREDKDGNGILDSIEDANNNGRKDLDEILEQGRERYARECRENERRMERDADFKERIENMKAENAKEEEEMNKRHGRGGIMSMLGIETDD